MLVNFLKFIHILFTLGLLGSVIYCLALIGSRKFAITHFNQHDIITRVNKTILVLVLFAVITGTFLVYPKHFTFHTPWIQAAYLLVIIFSFGISLLILLKKKRKQRWLWQMNYLFLITLLIFIIHDAVTKTTFLF